MCDYCNGESILFGSHDYECTDKTTGEVKTVMNLDAAVIPDNKTLEINIGVNGQPVFINRIAIEYCPKCGRKL